MKKKILALLLAAVMILSLWGCQKSPVPTEPSPTELVPTEATEPVQDAQQLYADTCAFLGSADVTLDVVTTKTTIVEDQTLTADITQVLTYAGVGTDDPTILLEETVPYWEFDAAGEMVATDVGYKELYTEGVLYVALQSRAYFSTELLDEELEDRYVPAVLLDSALYEDVTVAENGGETVITFAQPVSGETWAVPEEGQVKEATGTVVIIDSAISAMTYTVTYEYGPVTVTQTTESKPRPQAETITVPEKTDHYVPLQSADALYMFMRAKDLSNQTTSGYVTDVGSMFTHAGAAMKNSFVEFNRYGTGEDLAMKVDQSLFIMDYYRDESESTDVEETYQNGRYVYTQNGGVPTTYTTIEPADMEAHYRNLTVPRIAEPEYWQNVTMELLDDLYYLEFAFNEDYGNACQNLLAQDYWGDAAYLNAYASAYVTDECIGYLSIDKYSGLLVAAGYKYQGTHTIDGLKYIMTNQSDQSFTLPCFGAYKEVTGELPPEQEPEQKATPLFYHVTGENGQEMWLLGTIHVGDSRTAYLPQEIYDAFSNANALAVECDTEAFDEQQEADDELAEQVSDLYFYTDGSMTSDHLDEELYATALKYLKATGNYNMNTEYMKPSVWSTSIENFFLRQGRTLRSEQGVEERLTKLAHEQEKEIQEVESSLFQIEMITGWSEDLQEQLLTEAMSFSAEEYYESVNELYEMWCAGDEETLREYLNSEVDTSEMTAEELAEYEEYMKLQEEYEQAMETDRNEGMLGKAIEYLESGDVIFFAVGLAHLLDDTNGLVDTLREAGYTVEPVIYQ